MPPPPADRPPTDRRRDLLGFGLGLAGITIFGGTLPMTRIALTGFSPMVVTFGRAAIAAVLAGALLLVLRRRIPPRRTWTSLAIAAVCTVFGFPLFSALALQTVPASHGGVVLALLPLLTSIAAVFVNGERPSAGFWAFGILGAAAVLAFTLRESSGGFEIGDVWLLIAGTLAGIGYAHYARIAADVPGWESISWALVLCAPVTIPATLLALTPAELAPPAPAVAGLLYVSVFSVFIGFFFWNAGLAIGGVARVGQVQLLQAFVTIGLAALLNGETIGWDTLGFAALVVAIVIAARKQSVAKAN
jgi:drug/metabolite transporter (DMT)-like permease